MSLDLMAIVWDLFERWNWDRAPTEPSGISPLNGRLDKLYTVQRGFSSNRPETTHQSALIIEQVHTLHGWDIVRPSVSVAVDGDLSTRTSSSSNTGWAYIGKHPSKP